MPFSPVSSLLGQFFNSTTTTISGTAEVSVFPTGVGTKTIPAGWFQPGYNARVIARGTVTTPLIAGTTTVRIKNGSTVLHSVATSSLLGALNGPSPFAVIFNLQCYTTGTNGTFGLGGEVRYPVGLAGLQPGSLPLQVPNQVNTSPLVINTTQPIDLDVTAQWSGTSHSLQMSIATLELMSM